MEFELNRYDLYDLQIDLDQKLFVDCEPDPEYSPKEGLFNRFFWSIELQLADGTRKNITDELTQDDKEIIEQQIEEFFHD
jgi:hypothetical protein